MVNIDIMKNKRTKDKLVVKFNNGNGAILCSNCSVIIKEGREFTEDEWKALRGEIRMEPQYCEKCKTTEAE